MIRGYNFPSGVEEKVKIDGNKVTQKMNLYSFQNQVIMDVEAPPSIPSKYTYQGKLYDGSKLYMKTKLTTVTNGSSDSSAGCTGNVLLVKPDGTQLEVEIPVYDIPSRSETGSSPDSYTYSCSLHSSPDGDVFLKLQRKFKAMNGSQVDHSTYYQSIYQLNIDSSLSWITKVIEVSLGAGVSPYGNYIIENNYIYFAGGSTNTTRYIYGYKYSDISYQFSKLSPNGISNSYDTSEARFLVRKGKATYIYFWTVGSSTPIEKWIAITRQNDGTYEESSGTASLSRPNKQLRTFMLNDEVYIWGLGTNSGFKGFHIYKLNTDNSAWEEVYNIANVFFDDIAVYIYFNGSPDAIFQGGPDGTIDHRGKFKFIAFSPGTLKYSQIPTPTILLHTNSEDWRYKGYKCNNIGQYIFFFEQIFAPLDSEVISIYKCALQPTNNNSSLLYSTFKESDITG